MFLIFLFTLFLVTYTFSYALLLNNNIKYNTYIYTKTLIFSVIIISFLSLLINFFLPLNIYISSLIPLFGLLLLIKFKKLIFRLSFLKFLFLISFLITIFLTESNVYRPDAGLYHLPFIGILNTEKIIIGISNLHSRYAHTSIIQYFDAINNNFILKNNGIVFGGALIASAVILNFISLLNYYLKISKFNFHFFFIFFCMIYISYKMNRYSEFGNDAPSHFLIFFLISEILLYSKKITTHNYLNNIILSLFIVQNKITLIFIILVNLIGINKIDYKILFLNKKFFFINIFFFIWLTKNILVSGCIIYPLEFTCFNELSWTNHVEIANMSILAEAWTKGWSNLPAEHNITMSEFINNFYWIKTWISVHGKVILNILGPYIVFSILLLIVLFFKGKKKIYEIDTSYHFLFLILIFCSLMWFIKSPIYRYGYSFIISVIIFVLSYISLSYELNKNKQKKILNSILIICIVIITGKNLLRIINSSNNYTNYPWPKYYSMSQNNVQAKFKVKKVNHLEILNPINGYCMYVAKICSHYETKDDLIVEYVNGYKFLKKNSSY